MESVIAQKEYVLEIYLDAESAFSKTTLVTGVFSEPREAQNGTLYEMNSFHARQSGARHGIPKSQEKGRS